MRQAWKSGVRPCCTRRGDREPITVVVFGPFEPMPDPQGLCRQYGESRDGTVSVQTAPLQRLGVSPDSSGVVFEVTTASRSTRRDTDGDTVAVAGHRSTGATG